MDPTTKNRRYCSCGCRELTPSSSSLCSELHDPAGITGETISTPRYVSPCDYWQLRSGCCMRDFPVDLMPALDARSCRTIKCHACLLRQPACRCPSKSKTGGNPCVVVRQRRFGLQATWSGGWEVFFLSQGRSPCLAHTL